MCTALFDKRKRRRFVQLFCLFICLFYSFFFKEIQHAENFYFEKNNLLIICGQDNKLERKFDSFGFNT